MTEFEQRYKTPLAQKQYELEQAIKIFEVKRAENVRTLLYGIAGGFAFILVMGGLIGYGTFPGGYVVHGWLSLITCGTWLAGMAIIPVTEQRAPNLHRQHADWIK